MSPSVRLAMIVFAVAVAACSGGGETKGDAGSKPVVKLTKEELMKPETCKECHARHYREWASSMHAYAAKDPIFLAMNKRGQEETNGELGDFCMQCHAPLAVKMGLTENGAVDVESLPEEVKGVTCYFCHNVESVSDVHDNLLGVPANNPLVLAMDTIMRGGFGRPGEADRNPSAVDSPAHDSAYSPWLDGDDGKSAVMCGSCHDIVTPVGVHLERTFKEWEGSKIGDPSNDGGQNTCIDCHMHSRSGLAAQTDKVERLPFRVSGVHSHLFPGVDVALTAHPDIELQKQAILCELNETLIPYAVKITQDGNVAVEYDAAGTGHFWPSGATQDRRAFFRLRAFDADGNVIKSMGEVRDDQSVMEAAAEQPGMRVLRDTMYDADGNEVHMFWDAVSTAKNPDVIKTAPKDAFMLIGTHSTEVAFPAVFAFPAVPAQIEVMAFIRPVGHEVVHDLLDSGHLQQFGADESLIERIPTLPLHSTRILWDHERDGFGIFPNTQLGANQLPNCRKDLDCMLDENLCEAAQ